MQLLNLPTLLGEAATAKTELSQAIARVSLVAFLTLYYTLISHHKELDYIGYTYLAFSGVWLGWVKLRPNVNFRKYITLVTDILAITIALCISGSEHLGLFLLYLWVTLGNGYRYGSEFVKYGGVLTACCLIYILASNPEWNHEASVALEIFVIMGLLMMFIYQILSSMEKQTIDQEFLKQRAKQFEDKALRDNLTHLCNREYVDVWLRRKQKSNSRVGILFLDLDNFKNFNDNYGHHVGDHVLINISKRLTNCVRSQDIVCRYAGDEFIILINDEDEDTITDIANRITNALNQSVEIEGGERLTVTGSIGIAIMGMHGQTPAEVLRNADAAMYMAKRKGRNTVAWYEEKIKV